MLKKVLLLSACLSCYNAFAQQLSLFPDLIVKSQSRINAIADASDNEYIIATQIDHVNGIPTGNIVKIDKNGNAVQGFAKNTLNGDVWKIITQPDGKILAVGTFTKINGLTVIPLVRFEADGSIDPTFSSFLLTDQYRFLSSIATQSDGKIIVVGDFYIDGYHDIARLNTDGSVDNSFTAVNLPGALPNIYHVETDSNNNIWLCDSRSVYRIQSNGSLYSGFPLTVGSVESIYKMSVYNDQVYVGGSFSTLNGTDRQNIAKINADGSLDETFIVANANTAMSVAAFQDGRLVVRGLNAVSLYNANGSQHSQLAFGLPSQVHLDKNENLLISGSHQMTFGSETTPFLGRLTTSLQKDNTFRCVASYTGEISAIASYTDGRMLIGGKYEVMGFNDGNKKLVRVNADGTFDTSFTAEIPADVYWSDVKSLLVQGDGKVIVAYSNQVGRLNPSGKKDDSFPPIKLDLNSNNLFSGVKSKKNKLYVFGAFDAINNVVSPGILKMNSDGSYDDTFKSILPSGSYVTDMTFQSTEKLVLCGHFPFQNGAKSIVRLNANGDIDNSLTGESASANGVWKIRCDSQDNIYVSGGFYNYGTTGLAHFIKLSANGTPDLTFTPSLPFPLNDRYIHSLEILSDDEILVGNRGYRYFSSEEVIAVVDASGNLLDRPYTHIGENSSISTSYFDGITLFLGGRIVSEDESSVSGIAVNRINTVTEIENKQPLISGVHPNPGTGIYEVSLPTASIEGTYHVQDANGSTYKTGVVRVHDGSFSLDLSGLRPGLYIIKIAQGQQQSSFKLIKK